MCKAAEHSRQRHGTREAEPPRTCATKEDTEVLGRSPGEIRSPKREAERGLGRQGAARRQEQGAKTVLGQSPGKIRSPKQEAEACHALLETPRNQQRDDDAAKGPPGV